MVVDVLPSERLKAYSDAFFSIVATLMVIPLAHLEEDDISDAATCYQGNDCAEWIEDVKIKLLNLMVLLLTFYIVTSIWKAHSVSLNGLEVVHGSILRVTLMQIMPSVAFLPISARIATQWQSTTVGPVIYIANAWVVALTFAMLLRCTLPRPSRAFIALIPTTLASVAAILVSLFVDSHLAIGVFLGGIMILTSVFTRLGLPVVSATGFKSGVTRTPTVKLLSAAARAVRGKSKRAKGAKPNTRLLFNKSRLEAFTDGVHGIVATLVILDVKVPLSDTQNSLDTLLEWLGDNTVLLATSISTLFLVSVLWMTNRLAVSLTPERVANQLYTSNTIICIAVALVPFGNSFLVSIDARWRWLPMACALLALAVTYTYIVVALVKKAGPATQATTNPMNGPGAGAGAGAGARGEEGEEEEEEEEGEEEALMSRTRRPVAWSLDHARMKARVAVLYSATVACLLGIIIDADPTAEVMPVIFNYIFGIALGLTPFWCRGAVARFFGMLPGAIEPVPEALLHKEAQDEGGADVEAGAAGGGSGGDAGTYRNPTASAVSEPEVELRTPSSSKQK